MSHRGVLITAVVASAVTSSIAAVAVFIAIVAMLLQLTPERNY